MNWSGIVAAGYGDIVDQMIIQFLMNELLLICTCQNIDYTVVLLMHVHYYTLICVRNIYMQDL